MANKIAFINGKGGCGKSTSIIHTAGVLAQQNQKVLVIDFDKQRNTTDTLLMNSKNKSDCTIFDFMQGVATASDVTTKSLFQVRGNSTPKYYGVDCMASDIRLKDESIIKKINSEEFGNKLNDFIKNEKYDWVLVDMPPSNEELNNICFERIVDHVIIPFSSDIFSVSGYGDIMDTIQLARELNEKLNILGIFLSKHMKNCAVDNYIKEQLKTFGEIFIDIQIPHRADIKEGVMFGRPISFFKPKSKSKVAYENLVKEIKNRIKKNEIVEEE